jgi:hypothetical protein
LGYLAHVRFGSNSEIPRHSPHVCYSPSNRHAMTVTPCPLRANKATSIAQKDFQKTTRASPVTAARRARSGAAGNGDQSNASQLMASGERFVSYGIANERLFQRRGCSA